MAMASKPIKKNKLMECRSKFTPNKIPITKGIIILKKGIFVKTLVIRTLKLKKNPVWLKARRD
jgi:hypothetical protein